MYICMQEFWPLEFKRESMVVIFEVNNSAIPSHSGTSFALWAISDESEDAFTGSLCSTCTNCLASRSYANHGQDRNQDFIVYEVSCPRFHRISG
jgi:hypothetical protein